jgi:hypothetical protein
VGVASGLVRPAEGEVLHFSEDSNITSFVPHVAATARHTQAYVWAVDGERAPDYWFPRACPRVLTWPTPRTTRSDRDQFLGKAVRVHAIEYRWLPNLQSTVLHAYRLAASDFRPFGEPEPHAQVATVTVHPLGPPEPVGSLLDAHQAAEIELRILPNLWPYWKRVISSTVGFSGIRIRDALPDPEVSGVVVDSADEVEVVRATERERLRALVDKDMESANKLHADDFELIDPSAQVSSKQQYLDGIASGDVTYRVWEPDTRIDVRFYGVSAIVRYRSRAEVVIGGQTVPYRGAWHTDLYEKRGDQWQVVWSQATGLP